MKIICKCGNIVCEGEIKTNDKHKIRFYIKDKPDGTILKNNSNNPNNWDGICFKCQKSKRKSVK